MKYYMYDYPGRTVTFEFFREEITFTQKDLTKIAVDAIYQFCGEPIVPLSADLGLCYFDKEFVYSLKEPRPKSPYWYTRLRECFSKVDLEPGWVNPQINTTENLDAAELYRWISTAMDIEERGQEDKDVSYVIGWNELSIRATRVRLPELPGQTDGDFLNINMTGNDFSYPLERDGDFLYMNGPMIPDPLTPPVYIRVHNDDETLTMHISIYLDLFTKPQYPGWEMTYTGLKSLHDSGWKCIFNQIDGIDFLPLIDD